MKSEPNWIAFFEMLHTDLSANEICAFNRRNNELLQAHVHDAVRRGVPLAVAQQNYIDAVLTHGANCITAAHRARVAAEGPVVPEPPEPPSLVERLKHGPQFDPRPTTTNRDGVEDAPDLAQFIHDRRTKERKR